MFKESSITNNIEISLKHYLDDKFVREGAYFDISNSSGYYGNLSTLSRVNLPEYTLGRVWQTRRQNWMWESGIVISGVWVNNTLMTSGYKLNYRDGYVLFNSPVSGTVRLNYSCKYVEIRENSETNFINGDFESFNVADSQFIAGSGYRNKMQMPFVTIEDVGSKTEPYELGSRVKYQFNTFIINVVTEDSSINNKIRDKIQADEETYIKIFDVEASKRSGVYPMSKDGFLVNSSGTYQHLSDNFKFDKSSRSDCFVTKIINEGVTKLPNGLYHGTLKLTLETILSV